MNKIILKQGDTFAGILEMFRNGTGEAPAGANEFIVSATVRGVGGTFTDFVQFTKTGDSTWTFVADTLHWGVGNAEFDIQVSLRGQVISIPTDSNIYIEIKNGVTF